MIVSKKKIMRQKKVKHWIIFNNKEKRYGKQAVDLEKNEIFLKKIVVLLKAETSYFASIYLVLQKSKKLRRKKNKEKNNKK
jgi:hypothetical protein